MATAYGEVDGETPDPLFFRTERYRAGMVFPPRRQVWGEFNYALEGVAEIVIEGERYLSPPHYAIWVPPGFEHEAHNAREIRYVTVYVAAELCIDLPAEPSTLALSPLMKAILADFDRRSVRHPKSAADRRLAMVIVDQIRAAPRFAHYLPLSDDPLIAPILQSLQDNPGDRRSASEWARFAGTTERTLARHCLEQLGMPFNDWRQRLRLVASLALLEDGFSVQDAAKRLGYSTPSAFIAMFRRMTGMSPTQLRQG
ncbi:AraC family transcriptional regulator [Agrobacterium sp. ES01]|uniref:AraC family transcriptional regulator n=1 Tax=Agrobacterium sp. ES01 TaxID=3420714 RepID=UPI003D09F55E